MSGRSDAGVNVFQMPAAELKGMIMAHAASAQTVIDELTARMAELPEGSPEDGPRVKTSREIYEDALVSVKQRRDETIYIAEHVAPGDHRMSAAELLAFRRGYGPLKIDYDKLKWAPQSAAPPDAQAERSLGDTLIKAPRLVLPPGMRIA